jgi:hypothetical protein
VASSVLPAPLIALGNRRFRTVLLIVAGVPVAAQYLWLGFVSPLFLGAYLGDFQESYLRAAQRLASGQDPYDLCQTMGCLEPTGPQYVMPPLLAWLLQPFAGADHRAVTIAAVLILQASLVLFFWCLIKALDVRDWQLIALLATFTLTFEPVIANVFEGQVNLLLLGLSGVWLLGWVRERWWGGAPLGLAVALKLIQGPLGLLVLWRQRWTMLVAAALTGAILWLIASPQYLVEYFLKVAPAIGQGTGLFENHSPGGTIARLLQPDTFLGAVRGTSVLARVVTIAIAVAAIAVTYVVMRSPAATAAGRNLEAATAVAMTPLVATYSWGTHLVLLLLPMLVLIVWGIRNRHWAVLALVGAAWFLIGPAHSELQQLLLEGYRNLVVLRVMAEFGVVGVLAVWVGCLIAIRSPISEPT